MSLAWGQGGVDVEGHNMAYSGNIGILSFVVIITIWFLEYLNG